MPRLLLAVMLVTAFQIPLPPWKVMFNPSPDHSVVDNVGVPLVSKYELVLSKDGKVVTQIDLGKPTPNAQGIITIDVNATILSLSSGNYTGVVNAIGPGGVGTSLPSPPFSLTGPMRVPVAPGLPTFSRQ